MFKAEPRTDRPCQPEHSPGWRSPGSRSSPRSCCLPGPAGPPACGGPAPSRASGEVSETSQCWCSRCCRDQTGIGGESARINHSTLHTTLPSCVFTTRCRPTGTPGAALGDALPCNHPVSSFLFTAQGLQSTMLQRGVSPGIIIHTIIPSPPMLQQLQCRNTLSLLKPFLCSVFLTVTFPDHLYRCLQNSKFWSALCFKMDWKESLWTGSKADKHYVKLKVTREPHAIFRT